MSASIGFLNHNPELISGFREELFSIAGWWVDNVFDFEKGDFVGEVDAQNNAMPTAGKGNIYNSRLLWFFSKIAKLDDAPLHRQAADIAYRKLLEQFWDSDFGGVYWSVDRYGNVVDSKKHLYSQAFSIYGLCAYYSLTAAPDALSKAVAIYESVESNAYDPEFGYNEAFTRQWQKLEDTRLNSDEPIHPRNVNAQLHLMEAYTALYKYYPEPKVFNSLKRLVNSFLRDYIDHRSFHLKMYLDADWQDCSTFYSYGHDIECSWLILEATETLKDPVLMDLAKKAAIGMSSACLKEGVREFGGMIDSYDRITNKPIVTHTWWVQAEAMVGFLNAYQLSGELKFYDAFIHVWQFIKTYQIDHAHGEWYWSASLDKKAASLSDYKAGFWKGPYHNGRALMEVYDRMILMSDRV